jgi:dihydrofolate synthase/folylpolyglutamate synthase
MDQEAEADNRRPLTFFEVTTAAAFWFFAQQQAEAVVLEVGLGGRLDSTNVCQPQVSVITNISFDHTKQLGNTLGKIAFEKAGIIKPGVPVISGVVGEEAASVISEVAAERSAPLAVWGRDFEILEGADPEKFTVKGQLPAFKAQSLIASFEFEVSQLKLGMIGTHQRTNATIAVAAIESLNQRHWSITDDQIRDGLATAHLPGRTEIVSQQPLVIIDIAHNVASAAALAVTLQQFSPWQAASTKTLIFATSRDKDAAGMLKNLLPHFDRVVFTKYQNNPRGVDPGKLHELAISVCDSRGGDFPTRPKFYVIEHPEEAWKHTAAGRDQELPSPTGQAICIAGSAFLVAELRPLVLDSINR